MKAKTALPLLIAATALATLAGCRAAGSARTNRPPAADDLKISAFKLDEFVQEHNRNARLIRTINAKPSISVTMASPDGGDPMAGGLNGRLLVSQPHDFKLLVQRPVTTSNVADIGSNEHEFWFWVRENAEKGVYRCAYEDLGKSNLKATYQPDWIVTAMGLKPITRDEAAAAKTTPGDRPGLTVVKFPPSRDPASAYVREMVVEEKTNRMIGFRAYDRDGKTLLGEATIQRYYDVAVKTPADPGADPAVEPSPATCHVPDRFVLRWVDEKLTLDIAMSSKISGPKLNVEFSQTALAEFVPPRVSGYESIDLAELGRTRPRGEPGADDPDIRETIPVPDPAPSRRRADVARGDAKAVDVKLGPPVEIRGARLQSPEDDFPDDPSRRATKRSPRHSSAPRAATDPFLLPVDQELIGPALPHPPRTPFRETADEPLIKAPHIEL